MKNAILFVVGVFVLCLLLLASFPVVVATPMECNHLADLDCWADQYCEGRSDPQWLNYCEVCCYLKWEEPGKPLDNCLGQCARGGGAQ